MGLLQRYCNQSLYLSSLTQLLAIPAARKPDQERTGPVRHARQLRPAEVEALVADYRAGARVGELATAYGIHRSTLGKHLDEQGVVRRMHDHACRTHQPRRSEAEPL